MAKVIAKIAAKAERKVVTIEDLEAHYLFHSVEVISGKKFPVGKHYDCIKVGTNSYGKTYVLLDVDGTDTFGDPANVKPLKALPEARAAALKARLEADREATLLVSVTVRGETENGVLFRHHGWFRPAWFPKSLVARVGENGEEDLYEVPMWKVRKDMGQKAVDELEALQAGYQKMLEPAKPAPVARKGRK